MYTIPTSIDIDGKQFKIRNNGDYRMVLDCFSALNDAELNTEERLFCSLIIFYEDLNDLPDIQLLPDLEVAIVEMFKFFNCGSSTENTKKVSHKLIDWDADSQLICSAINRVAGTEVRAEKYMHWWTFMGYYSAIGECLLSTVVSIRDKLIRGKKLEKTEREFRQQNPQYFVWDSSTSEDKEADALFNELWNQGG